MKRKGCFSIVLFVVIAVIAVSLLKDQILKGVITTVASGVTGARVEIEKFSLGVISQSVRIEGFTMYNPAGFPDEVMLDIPRVSVSCSIPALVQGKIYLPKAEFRLHEVVLIKSKEGKMNVQALKFAEVKEQPKQEKKKKEPAQKEKSQEMALQIDELTLDIGKVIYKDYTAGAEPAVKVYDVSITKTFKDISSVNQLGMMIMSEAFLQAGVKGLVSFGAGTIKQTPSAALGVVKGIADIVP